MARRKAFVRHDSSSTEEQCKVRYKHKAVEFKLSPGIQKRLDARLD
jgi:hypothetical protein